MKRILPVLLLFTQPLAAVLPPPDVPERDALTVCEGPGVETPQSPSRTYAVQGSSLRYRFAFALEHSARHKKDFWVGWSAEGKGVVLMRYTVGEKRPRVLEVRPVEAPRCEAGVPLYWLGRAETAESEAAVSRVFGSSRVEEVRRSIAALQGSGRDAEVQGWISSRAGARPSPKTEAPSLARGPALERR
jgi:hypothetical protein